uniref:DNA 3'-5' helicase n=1 Tax=Amphimedon queenslandica TaxID=400682 RepID=A0A1X7VVY3_AMPQE
MEKTFIFCRRPIDCAEFWSAFYWFLKQDMTDPPGVSLKILELRIVDYYTGRTQESVRNTILKQFSIDHSCLRVLIATVALGLGVNCSNVSRVIHFCVPEDIETYVQQIGRAGRVGSLTQCTMLFGCGVYKKFCNQYVTIIDKSDQHKELLI